MREAFARRVGAHLGSEVRGASRVSGGDVAESYRVVLADGRTVFAKTHADPPPHFFATEATGLGWLADAATRSHVVGLEVARVLAVDDDLLVLAWIDEGLPVPSSESEFGRALARIHRLEMPVFGRPDRRTTGSRRLPNEPCSSWPEFYANDRLEPLARLARDEAALSDVAVDRIESIAARLAEVPAADERPALLHGDLWAGNRLVDDRGTSWLIDPAAHGGHREFDLAMMALFGGFGDACWEAYDDEHPLADGWRERVPLHQLAPLIVHAIKFGGGYVAAVDRALDVCRRIT